MSRRFSGIENPHGSADRVPRAAQLTSDRSQSPPQYNELPDAVSGSPQVCRTPGFPGVLVQSISEDLYSLLADR